MLQTYYYTSVEQCQCLNIKSHEIKNNDTIEMCEFEYYVSDIKLDRHRRVHKCFEDVQSPKPKRIHNIIIVQ